MDSTDPLWLAEIKAAYHDQVSSMRIDWSKGAPRTDEGVYDYSGFTTTRIINDYVERKKSGEFTEPDDYVKSITDQSDHWHALFCRQGETMQALIRAQE